MKMTDKELNEIIDELKGGPMLLRTAIKTYNSMKDGPNKKQLGKDISNVKENLRVLDVMLEDIQWDIEREEVNKMMKSQND